jgi:hypothetical protein
MADEAGVLDFVGVDLAATASPDASVAEVETPVADVTPAADSAPAAEATPAAADGKEAKQQYNSDGSPKEAAVSAKAEDLPGTEKTPTEIRQALKSLRDLDPKHAAAVKQLHGAYERYEAIKAIFPGGVSEIKAAKEFSDLVGGHEGFEALTSLKGRAEASDGQLYEGNPQLIEDIVADLKGQGKLDALGKLAPSFLDAVKANDEAGYKAAFAPHFLSGLDSANLPAALDYLIKGLSDPDPAKAVATAKEAAADIKNWYDKLAGDNKKLKENVVSPERKQLEADRASFLKQQEDFKTSQGTEFKNSVAKSCESVNNKSLGASLGSYLKMPFFVGFGRENLMPLGNTIKTTLYDTLKADNAYQAQMKAMWGAKTPDRAKIEEYHKAKVDSLSEDLVRGVVQRMYPGYAKGGAAAGRVAAKEVKAVVAAKVDATAVATGKPIYVAQKPKDLDRTRKDATLLEITGKGYVPDGKGGFRYVTWRK